MSEHEALDVLSLAVATLAELRSPHHARAQAAARGAVLDEAIRGAFRGGLARIAAEYLSRR